MCGTVLRGDAQQELNAFDLTQPVVGALGQRIQRRAWLPGVGHAKLLRGHLSVAAEGAVAIAGVLCRVLGHEHHDRHAVAPADPQLRCQLGIRVAVDKSKK